MSRENERRFIGHTLSNLSWRFIPDDDLESEVLDEGKKDFDKDRQKQDQEAANQRKYQEAQAAADKARQEAEEAESRATQLAQEKAELQQKLADAQLKAEEQGIDDIKLDESQYQDSDVPLVRAINSLKAQLVVANKKIQNHEKVKDDLLAQQQRDQETAARNKVYDDLLDELDEEYGAQHRNAAVAAFDALVKAGEIKKGDPAKATRMMEKCYKGAKADAEKANKDKTVPLDSTGGNAPGGMTSLKLQPGSLEEVEAQVANAMKK